MGACLVADTGLPEEKQRTTRFFFKKKKLRKKLSLIDKSQNCN